MIKRTAFAVWFAPFWHAFLLRKALVGSMLYVELVTLLDLTCRSQMSKTRFKKLGKLRNRLVHLHAEGKVLEIDQLQALRKRRNKIGHDVEQHVPLPELDAAIAIVHRQLVSWKLVAEAPPNFEPFIERSQVRESDRPGYGAMHDWTVGVNREGRTVYTAKWNEYLGNDEAGG